MKSAIKTTAASFRAEWAAANPTCPDIGSLHPHVAGGTGDETFWAAWATYKDELKAQGVKVTKSPGGEFTVKLGNPPKAPGEKLLTLQQVPTLASFLSWDNEQRALWYHENQSTAKALGLDMDTCGLRWSGFSPLTVSKAYARLSNKTARNLAWALTRLKKFSGSSQRTGYAHALELFTEWLRLPLNELKFYFKQAAAPAMRAYFSPDAVRRRADLAAHNEAMDQDPYYRFEIIRSKMRGEYDALTEGVHYHAHERTAFEKWEQGA